MATTVQAAPPNDHSRSSRRSAADEPRRGDAAGSAAVDCEAPSAITHVRQLQQMPAAELIELARSEGVANVSELSKHELIRQIVHGRCGRGETIAGGGTLEVLPDGYGFLRQPERSYASSPEDIYVAQSQIARLGLRSGVDVEGLLSAPKTGANLALRHVQRVNGMPCDQLPSPVLFEDLTPLHPSRRLLLETTADQLSMRVVDLVAPIGKGQRGLIVSPPRAGKTVLLQNIARSVLKNHPDCYLIVLLVDERPEEVTDMRRNVVGAFSATGRSPANGGENETDDRFWRVQVIASTFDAPPENHVHAAELVLERAKRLVEYGHDVVILLDSITRLARAYNTLAPADGKIMSGGLMAGVLEKPKRFFGAARDTEEGGSLTVLATALIDTGSRMDEVIFEEFKGTGNMEIYLDRRLVDRRIWPAIDINRSGTRREELLLDDEERRRVWQLRRTLAPMDPVEAMQLLTARLAKTRSNAEFLMALGAVQ